MLTVFDLGDRVQMRKNHACGGNEWEITRTGADIRIKCVNCGRSVMLDRLDFMRAAKKRTFVSNAGNASAVDAQVAMNTEDSDNK